MPQTFYRDRSTWLAYLWLAFFAYFLNIMGPITPFLKEELQMSYTMSSLHFTAFAIGILCTGFGGHWLVRRLGRWRSMGTGGMGVSLAVLLLLTGWTPIITIAASFLMGLLGGLILATVPAALSDLHGERRAVALSEANIISSLAATAAPLLVGWFAYYSGHWRLALGLVAVIPILLFLISRKGTAPVAASTLAPPTQAGPPLPLLFWIYWLALVLSISVEFCMIYWSADYLEQVLGMAKADAAQAVSLFLAGMIVGRIAGSRLVQRFATRSVVLVSILIAGLGFLIFWRTETVFLGLSGLFITGLGVASLFPLIVSLAMGAASDNTVQASARVALATGTAILALPLVLGRLADAVNIRWAYGVVIPLLITVFMVSPIDPKIGPRVKIESEEQ